MPTATVFKVYPRECGGTPGAKTWFDAVLGDMEN